MARRADAVADRSAAPATHSPGLSRRPDAAYRNYAAVPAITTTGSNRRPQRWRSRLARRGRHRGERHVARQHWSIRKGETRVRFWAMARLAALKVTAPNSRVGQSQNRGRRAGHSPEATNSRCSSFRFGPAAELELTSRASRINRITCFCIYNSLKIPSCAQFSIRCHAVRFMGGIIPLPGIDHIRCRNSSPNRHRPAPATIGLYNMFWAGSPRARRWAMPTHQRLDYLQLMTAVVPPAGCSKATSVAEITVHPLCHGAHLCDSGDAVISRSITRGSSSPATISRPMAPS